MSSARDTHLEFQHTVEGLFLKELAGDLTPALREDLREAGLDLSRPLDPAFPSMRYMEWLRITARHLHPELPPAEGVRRIGRRMLRGYGQTFLGKTIFGVMSLIGVRRSLERITRSFRTGDNYSEATLEWLGKGEVNVTFNEVHDVPTYNQGILEQVLIELKAKDSKVELVSCPDGVEAVYRITWDEG